MSIIDPIAGQSKITTSIKNKDRGFNVEMEISGLPSTNLIPFNTKEENTLNGVYNLSLADIDK